MIEAGGKGDFLYDPENYTKARILTPEENKKLMAQDSMINLITGLGGFEDKAKNVQFLRSRGFNFFFNQVTDLYRENFIAGRIVDVVPDDMTRTWRRLVTDIARKEQVNQWSKIENEFQLRETFNYADKMARLYGGSLLVMDIEGTGELWEPLDLAQVRKGSLNGFHVIDARRASHLKSVDFDPISANFGQPEIYYIHGGGPKVVHSSRCIRFDGVRLPYYEYRQNRYWHDSILNRLYEPLVNTQTVIDTTANLVHESNIDTWSVPGLRDFMETDEDTNNIMKMIQLSKRLTSTAGIRIVDGDIEVSNDTKTFTGLSSLFDRYILLITSASDVPAARLLGDSASAFDISGSSVDLRNYYAGIKSRQELEYNPRLRVIDTVLAKHMGWGSGTELEFEWNSLFQKDPEEEAKAEKARAEVYSLYINNGIITPDMVAKDLQNNPYFENITKEDIDKLEKKTKELHELEMKKAKLEVELMEKQLESMNMTQQDSSTPPSKEKGTDKGTGENGKPDTGKQVRDMKRPEGTKEIRKKNQEARKRIGDKGKNNA